MANDSKPLWPASDWDTWPSTRWGAITIDIVAVILCVAAFFLARRQYSRPCGMGICEAPFKRWGFWLCGRDHIEINGDIVWLISQRCGCFFCTCAHNSQSFPKDSIRSIELVKRPVIFTGVAWAFFCACLFGIWLHFIPCIWWTCDWGPHDGEGIRGGIWFVTWGVLMIVFIFLHRTVALKFTVSLPTYQVMEYYISVGSGNHYDLGNPACRTELSNVQKMCKATQAEEI